MQSSTIKAIFLDRDGVINKDPGYVHKIDDFELYPDTIESLQRLHQFTLIIVTNQSGIGRKKYTTDQFHEFNNHLVDKLKQNNISIAKTYFCPHHPKDDCLCRKPNPTFIQNAKKEFNLDLRRSFMIGDHPSDVKFGQSCGCKSVYMLTGHGKNHFADLQENNIKPDYISQTLTEAVQWVLEENNVNTKTILIEDIETLSNNLRNEGKNIVTTNGSFDILHEGHDFYLKESKKQGDILIVGLNSDASIKQNKGNDMPINKETIRIRNLAQNKDVDYIIVFNEKTPIELLEKIKPDIHTNGEEYGEECIEKDVVKKNGGKIHLIKRIGDYSTSKIIRDKMS